LRVLITNDDGIDSPGLHALVERSSELGLSPVVAAPPVNLSGVSASLVPLDDPNRIQIEERHLPGFGDELAYIVGAPPALIVMLAMIGGFGEPPDLILAGVNIGPNTGRSTLFSGTIGAVMTGARFGRSGLATSLDVRPSAETTPVWSTATDLATPLIRWLVTAPQPTMLNLNAPNLPRNEVRGFCHADLAPAGRVRTEITGRDATGLDIDLVPTGDEAPAGTDSALLGDGYATVTSLEPIGQREGHLPISEWDNEIGVPGR
jgi:5'-nucleotidase